MSQRLARQIVCSILVAFCYGNALAMTGNELIDQCGSEKISQSAAFCLGYVSGIMDTEITTIIHATQKQQPTPEELKQIDFETQLDRKQLANWNHLAPYQQQLFLDRLSGRFDPVPPKPIWKCVPPLDQITNAQLLDVVIKYLRDNPAQRHLLAPSLVVDAIQDEFPCK